MQTIEIDTDPMHEGDLVQQVTVTFDEPMDPSTDPTITFSAGTFTSNGDGSWSVGNSVWSGRFRLTDWHEQIPMVAVRVMDTRDAVGNRLYTDSVVAEFEIDTGACLVVVPTGAAGAGHFLDSIFDPPAGKAVPMIGDLPLSAIHVVGDVITGSCQILDAQTEWPMLSVVHMFAYRLDLEVYPVGLELVDHWLARHDWPTRRYMFAWDTSELVPGHYELSLSFRDDTAARLRVAVVAQQED